MSATELYEHDEDGIRDLLVGRRIVQVEEGQYELPNHRWHTASGRLVLDDGTAVLVVPNEGGCSCGAGDYSISHLAAVDNIITSVRVVEEQRGEYGETAYQIFVVADAAEINVLSVEGDDGNGYYGTGYRLVVVPAESGGSR